MKKISLVFMLAGLSSRFEGKAKGLIQVGPNRETLLEYSMNQALKNSFSKIIFIVSKKTEPMYKEYFGNEYKKIPIEYAFQKFDKNKRERPWGTTDALCSAKGLIHEPFIICNGDDIYGKKAFEISFNHLQENETDVTLGYNLGKVVPEEGEVNRGIFEVDEEGNVKNIEENIGIEKNKLAPKGVPSEEIKEGKEKNLTLNSSCSMNIFGLNPETLKLLYKVLEEFKEKNKEDKTIECYLPKELGKLIKENKIKMKLYPTDENWYGLTNPEDEGIVRKKLKK